MHQMKREISQTGQKDPDYYKKIDVTMENRSKRRGRDEMAHLLNSRRDLRERKRNDVCPVQMSIFIPGTLLFNCDDER